MEDLGSFMPMRPVRILGGSPGETLVDAINLTADELKVYECWFYDGRYHFALGAGWTIALSDDSAGRIRVETCRLTRPVSSMWALRHRPDRLAGLVRQMSAVAEPA